MTQDALIHWHTIRLPATCQTLTDIDDDTGELLLKIFGVGPAPPPPSDTLTGIVVEGVVRYQADLNRCVLRNVKLEPLDE